MTSRRAHRRLGVLAAAATLLVVPGSANAHEGSPDYLSTIDSIRPALDGLTVNVVERDEGLRLRNRTGKVLIVKGYEGEPYLRILPNGVVQVNKRSPARYLNADRYAKVPVPKTADAHAAPEWLQIGRSGRVRWHDHRVHWMSETTSPALENKAEKTKVFNWSVPLVVGGRHVAIRGTLFWDPVETRAPGSGTPLGAIAGGVGGGILLVAAAVVFGLRRRRRPSGRAETEKAESW